jgi:hypothetical protein
MSMGKQHCWAGTMSGLVASAVEYMMDGGSTQRPVHGRFAPTRRSVSRTRRANVDEVSGKRLKVTPFDPKSKAS